MNWHLLTICIFEGKSILNFFKDILKQRKNGSLRTLIWTIGDVDWGYASISYFIEGRIVKDGCMEYREEAKPGINEQGLVKIV